MIARQRQSKPLLVGSEMAMLQFHPQPRTVRQRVENCQLISDYNSGYQDDVYDHISLAARSFSLLDSSFSSSLSEDSMSVTSSSSTGPLLAWPAQRSSTPIKSSTPPTPSPIMASFKHLAFIHKRINEKNNHIRKKVCKKRLEMRRRGSREKQVKKESLR